VELVLTTQDGRNYRMLYLVGAGTSPAKEEAEEGVDG
jgi:hypothetical protein